MNEDKRQKSPIEAILEQEFADVEDTAKQQPGKGGLGAAKAKVEDPVPDWLYQIRNDAKLADAHVNRHVQGDHRVALRRSLHRIRKTAERQIEMIQTGETLTGPIVRRLPT